MMVFARKHRTGAALVARLLAVTLILALGLARLDWLPGSAQGGSAGYALRFDGLANYAALGVTDAVFGGDWKSAKSVALWLRVDPGAAPAAVPTNAEVVWGVDRPRLFGVARAVFQGRDALWVWNLDANGIDYVPVDYRSDEWLHLAVTHDGMTLKAYKNGALVGLVASGPTNAPPASPGTMYLAGSGRAGASYYFAGQMEEAQFWRAALDADTIAAWMRREADAGHPYTAILGALYHMTDGSGAAVTDDSGRIPAAALLGGMGDAGWVVSSAPLQAGPPPTGSDTPLPSDTPAPTDTPLPSNTPTMTATPTNTLVPTDTPKPTDILPPSDTPTPTASPLAGATPTPYAGAPVEVAWLAMPGEANDVMISGSLAYVAATNGGLRVVDLSDPLRPREIGAAATPRRAYGVDLQGDYAYVAAGEAGLRIFDISNPAAPFEVGALATGPYYWDLDVVGQYVYLAARWDGLMIADVSDPAHPREVSRLATPDQALDVAVGWPYAYVATYELGGLRVVDVSDPLAPRETASFPSEHRMYGVELDGTRLYVADGGANLGIYDMHDPAAPALMSYLNTDGFSRSLRPAGGDLVYIADWNGGLAVANVANPAAPYLAATLISPGRVRDAAPYMGYAILAAYEGDLRVVLVR